MGQTKTKPKAKISLKYNIKSKLYLMDSERKNEIIRAVVQNSKRSRSTVNRVINVLKNQDVSIDYNILKEFARQFNCTVENLENPL